MANLITVKLDVRRLDKLRFFEGKPDQNGHRPLYADLVLVARKEVGKYGDTHIVKQSKKKDEQVDLPIIGSATERAPYGQSAPAPQPHRQSVPPPPPLSAPDESGDAPF
jgi:hypothetical protein